MVPQMSASRWLHSKGSASKSSANNDYGVLERFRTWKHRTYWLLRTNFVEARERQPSQMGRL